MTRSEVKKFLSRPSKFNFRRKIQHLKIRTVSNLDHQMRCVSSLSEFSLISVSMATIITVHYKYSPYNIIDNYVILFCPCVVLTSADQGSQEESCCVQVHGEAPCASSS